MDIKLKSIKYKKTKLKIDQQNHKKKLHPIIAN